EATLTSRLMSARKAIGDSGQEQRLIKTIHGRGYRFVGPVEEWGDEARLLVPEAVGPADGRGSPEPVRTASIERPSASPPESCGAPAAPSGFQRGLTVGRAAGLGQLPAWVD